MAIEFIEKYNRVELIDELTDQTPQQNVRQNVVSKVYYEITAKEEVKGEVIHCSRILEYDTITEDLSNFTDFTELTTSDLQSWVNASYNQIYIDELKNELSQSLSHAVELHKESLRRSIHTINH